MKPHFLAGFSNRNFRAFTTKVAQTPQKNSGAESPTNGPVNPRPTPVEGPGLQQPAPVQAQEPACQLRLACGKLGWGGWVSLKWVRLSFITSPPHTKKVVLWGGVLNSSP